MDGHTKYMAVVGFTLLMVMLQISRTTHARSWGRISTAVHPRHGQTETALPTTSGEIDFSDTEQPEDCVERHACLNSAIQTLGRTLGPSLFKPKEWYQSVCCSNGDACDYFMCRNDSAFEYWSIHSKLKLTTTMRKNEIAACPNDAFFPKTFLSSDDADVQKMWEMMMDSSSLDKKFICKADVGSQGKGIDLMMVRDIMTLCADSRGCSEEGCVEVGKLSNCLSTLNVNVIQEYMTNPLLVNGSKFDIRVHILGVVEKNSQLSLYLYPEGFTKISKHKFSMKRYGVERGPHVLHASDDIEWVTLAALGEMLKVDAESFKERFLQDASDALSTTFHAIRENIIQDMKQASLRPQGAEVIAWNLFAADFIMDSGFNAFLVDLNDAPGMTKAADPVFKKIIHKEWMEMAQLIHLHEQHHAHDFRGIHVKLKESCQ